MGAMEPRGDRRAPSLCLCASELAETLTARSVAAHRLVSGLVSGVVVGQSGYDRANFLGRTQALDRNGGHGFLQPVRADSTHPVGADVPAKVSREKRVHPACLHRTTRNLCITRGIY